MGFDHLYLWSDPLTTGPIFASVLLVLISICYYSLIAVVAYTGLFVLGTMAGVKLYVYVMNTFLKKNVQDPIQKYAGMDMTISEERIHEVSNCAASKVNCAVTELRRFFLIDNMVDSIKFGLSLWLLTYIGSWFNAMTLLILSWVGLFSIPKIYLNNQAAIDPILNTIKVQLDEVKAKVGAFLPAGKAAEAKKEE